VGDEREACLLSFLPIPSSICDGVPSVSDPSQKEVHQTDVVGEREEPASDVATAAAVLGADVEVATEDDAFAVPSSARTA
jgi:hypothetical protein